MSAIITATLVITTFLSPVQPMATLPAQHRLYLPMIMVGAPRSWPIARPTPTPRVVSPGFPLESLGYAWYYTTDGQRWVFYCDVTMSPRYPWTASDMMMLAWKGYAGNGHLLYENMGQHPADPSWVPPGGTARIEWDVPAADVPRGMTGWWAILRWR